MDGLQRLKTNLGGTRGLFLCEAVQSLHGACDNSEGVEGGIAGRYVDTSQMVLLIERSLLYSSTSTYFKMPIAEQSFKL